MVATKKKKAGAKTSKVTIAEVDPAFEPIARVGTPMKEWIAVPAGKQPWIALAKEAYAFAEGKK